MARSSGTETKVGFDQNIFRMNVEIRVEHGESREEAIAHAVADVRADGYPCFEPQLPESWR